MDVMYEETVSSSKALKRKAEASPPNSNATTPVARQVSSAKLTHLGHGSTVAQDLFDAKGNQSRHTPVLRAKRQKQDSQSAIGALDEDRDAETIFLPLMSEKQKEMEKKVAARIVPTGGNSFLSLTDATPVPSPAKPTAKSTNNSNSSDRASPNAKRREQDLGLTEHGPVTAFPLHNFYYFVKMCRAVFEAEEAEEGVSHVRGAEKTTNSKPKCGGEPKTAFKFDQLVDILYFAYTSLLSTKLLSVPNATAVPLRPELEALARVIWKKVPMMGFVVVVVVVVVIVVVVEIVVVVVVVVRLFFVRFFVSFLFCLLYILLRLSLI
jgi:hypothetical protein